MLPTDLKSPGFVPNGIALQQQAYRAISYADIVKQKSPDSDTHKVLAEFFEDCAKKCRAIKAWPKAPEPKAATEPTKEPSK